MAVDYAKLAQQAEQESSQPGGKYADLAQQAEMESNAPAPLSGPIGKIGVPQELQGPPSIGEGNREALQSGLKGIGKEFASTAQTIHRTNTPKEPGQAPVFAPSPAQGALDMDASASNDDERAGKLVGMGLEAAVPVGEGTAVAKEVLPSSARAGAKLQSIALDAIHQPVNLGRTVVPLSRVNELADAGSSLPSVIRKMTNRVQQGPMTYPQARDIYSNLAAPSFWEKMTTSPTAKREIGNLTGAFRNDIGDAAEAVGRGDDYRSALQEYRNAMRLKKIGLGVGTAAAGYGAKAAGVGALIGAMKKIGE